MDRLTRSSLLTLFTACAMFAQVGLHSSTPSGISVPPLSAFSQIGFTGGTGTATITQQDGTLYLTQTATSGDTFAGLVMSIAGVTAPYTYMIGFYPVTQSGQFALNGIMLRDSSTGNFVAFDLLLNGGYNLRRIHGTQGVTGSGTLGATASAWNALYAQGPVFLALQNDGTNINFKVCQTASLVTCQAVSSLSESKTAFAANIDQVGFYVDSPGFPGLNVMDVSLFKKVQ